MNKITLSNVFFAMTLISYILLITLSPSIHFIQYIEFHDAQRFFELCLLGFVLLHAATQLRNPSSLIFINKKLRLALYLLLFLTCLSSLMATSPRQSIIEVSMFIALCYLALFVANQFKSNNTQFVKYLVFAIWASILLYMLSFYVGYVTAMLVNKPLRWPQPFFGFSNIRIFQQYQLWGLGLICLPLLTFSLPNKNRMWVFIALALWWTLFFYAASRGAILGWFVALVITGLVYRKSALPFLRVQLINAFTGFIAYFVLFKVIPKTEATITTHSILRTTTYDRIALWKDAIELTTSSPLLGVGPMNYYWQSKLANGTYPHNTILQTAAEFGLPATLIIVSIFSYSFFSWFKLFKLSELEKESSTTKNLSIILFFTVTASATYSLFSGVTVMPISQVLMFTFIGLMIGQYLIKVSSSPAITNFRFRPLFALITLAAMTWSTLPEIKRGLTSYNRALGPYERAFSLAPNTIVPRIWMQQNKIMDEPKQ